MRDTIVLQAGDACVVRVTAAGEYRLHALMFGNYCAATIHRHYGVWWMSHMGCTTVYEDLDIALRDMWQLRKA